jgi:predicted DNA binding CopG/RHH family protein
MKKIEPVFKLTKEEKAMAAAVHWDSVRPATAKEKKEWAAIARNTLAKNKVITVRIPERNLIKIKAAAAREGLPYQTYITSLLHKHVR